MYIHSWLKLLRCHMNSRKNNTLREKMKYSKKCSPYFYEDFHLVHFFYSHTFCHTDRRDSRTRPYTDTQNTRGSRLHYRPHHEYQVDTLKIITVLLLVLQISSMYFWHGFASVDIGFLGWQFPILPSRAVNTLGQDAHSCMENKKLKWNSSMLYDHGHIIKQTAWWCFGQKCLFHYIPGELICLHSPVVDFQWQTLVQTFSFRVIFQCFRGKNVFLRSHEHRFCVQKIPMYLLFFKQPLKRLFPNDTE